jgi:chaperonin GroEL
VTPKKTKPVLVICRPLPIGEGLRDEDAMHATRAAVEEGIVPGGGVALLRCAAALEGLKVKGDEQTGAEIVRRALEEPLHRIVANSGPDTAVWAGSKQAAAN